MGMIATYLLDKKEHNIQLTTGAFLHPLTSENSPPPMAPIANAPPQSSTIRYGLKHVCINKKY